MTTEELNAIEKLTEAVKELDYTVTALLWSTIANNVGKSQLKVAEFEDCLRNTQGIVNSITNGIREAGKKREVI